MAICLGLACLGQAQTSKNMTQLSKYNPPHTQSSAAGIWGHTTASGKEIALFTTRNPGGIHFIDISNPIAPKWINFISGTEPSLWQEVHAYRITCYKVSQEGSDGLQVIDLSPLDQGKPALKIKNITSHFTVAHTLFIDTTVTPPRLFVAFGQVEGVKIFTLEDPRNPVLVHTIVGRTHDMFARGNRLYTSNQELGTLTIFDITDIRNQIELGKIHFGQVNPGLGEPAATLSHNAWPSEDDKYLFTTEEVAGASVKAFDISNPKSPKLVGTYIAAKNVVAHNVYVKGKLLYVAHYTAGLRVVDISDPAHMTEIAYHKPSQSTAEFGGSWGAYPWFKSGNIIHGDDIQGLFVTKINVLPASSRYRMVKSPNTILPMGDGRVFLNLPEAGPFRLAILGMDGHEVFGLWGAGGRGAHTLSLPKDLPARGKYVLRLCQHQSVLLGTLASGKNN